MFKKNINREVEQHSVVITCKKRARALKKTANENGEKLTLMQCQSLAAKELGYADWFDLHNQIKLQIEKEKETELVYSRPKDMMIYIFDMIIEDAIAESVSDIHFKLMSTHGQITMRKYGEIMSYQKGPMIEKEMKDLLAIVYNTLATGNEVAFAPGNIQSAFIEHATEKHRVRMLYNSLPIYPEGCEAVIKITQIEDLETNKVIRNEFVPLTHLGFAESHQTMIEKIMNNQRGSFFFAGPTGVGKSTSIVNTLKLFNARTEYKKRITTIEDLVEKIIPGVTQIPVPIVTTSSGMTQEQMDTKVINQVLRTDSDVIYLDDNVARRNMDNLMNLIRESFVVSQLHTSSALTTIRRLHSIGWSYEMMSQPDFLSGLAHQSLLKTLCPHCSVSFLDRIKQKNDPTDIQALEMLEKHYPQYRKSFSNIRVRGEGCNHCKQMGVNGRTACAEVIVIDDTMRELIRQARIIELEHYWRSTSDGDILSENMQGKTSLEHALQKMFNSLVDIHDVRKWFADFIDNRK